MSAGTTTAQFFDSYAHDFSAIYGNSHAYLTRLANALFRRSMRLRYQKTLAGCSPIAGRTVVDIGCGPGHYGVALAKAGAAAVRGIDFAPAMIQIARQHARQAAVDQRCTFEIGDCLTLPTTEKYDYAIVMGFMDYIADPRPLMEKVVSVTRGRAFFSFPKSGGPLAWQRMLRYRSRCPLYLYSQRQVHELCSSLAIRDYRVESIARDFFVTLSIG
jgi:2-polyprenyl-3-methyl-5-hydroxy-6-metoxy-1,4-benzoquinol methylase